MLLGGWTLSANRTYPTGNPVTVSAGYDVNANGVADDRPILLNQALYEASVDNGRANPATGQAYSSGQLPLSGFFSTIATPVVQLVFNPGCSGEDSGGRNTFFGQDMANCDADVYKTFPSGHRDQFRAEFYNTLNTPPLRHAHAQQLAFGRITSTNNSVDFVGISRLNDLARMLKFSLRYTL